MDSPCSSSGSCSTKSKNKFRNNKRNVSYSDLHSEGKNDVIKTPSSGIFRKQQGRSKGLQQEELVKYMSKLPSFLEKGEKVNAKPLNLGVLDWNTLENWQNYHPQRPSNRYSTSNSITTSSLWTDRSSIYYGRGDDEHSPSGHKGRRPSLHSYLNVSPIEGHSKHFESRAPNVANYTDIKAIPTNPSDRKQIIQRDSVFHTKSSELKLRKCNRESLDLQKTRSSTDFHNHGVPSSKGKLKFQADASKLESEKLQYQHDNSTHRGFSDKYNDVFLPRPGDSAESNSFSPFNLTRRSRELKEFISSDGFHLQEAYSKDLYPSILHSCALTSEINGSKEPSKEQNFPCSPSCAIKSVNQATSKILEEKSSIMPTDSSLTKSLKILNMKRTNSDSEAQNPSPSCRLSSVINRIRKSNHFRDNSDVLQQSSEDVTSRSGSEIADSSVCQNNATSDQSNAGSRDRFSPLKRLLNPLLKTKLAHSKFSDHSPKNSMSSPRFSAASYEQRELSSVHPLKVKIDTNIRTPNLDKSHCHKIQGSSTLQAYFQVSAKNDLPLFTFAVDNNSDALAATLRKFSSRKNDPTWIYTFFSIHELRRRSVGPVGWLSQGSNVKDYVPNVVAQMKVSDLPLSGLGGNLSVDQLRTREFVLHAVDLRLFDHQICDTQTNDELAAIVIKFPRKIITELTGSSLNVRVSSNSRNLQENKSTIGKHELFSTTVLLPGGIHGLPSKGEPSPLIERWFSGGQCDCGGWDLGCKVKVLSNNNQNPNGHFKLFSQSQEKSKQTTPFFMLSPLKNGIFSVEFDSTLSLLQAFSICVAVFDSMKPSESQQTDKFFEEKLAEEATLQYDCGPRTPKLVAVDLPAKFVSQPPHSPVERV